MAADELTEPKRLDAWFRAAVEAAPTAMLMLNAEGAILLVNAEAERVFGYPRGELLGAPVEMLLPARFRGQHPR